MVKGKNSYSLLYLSISAAIIILCSSCTNPIYFIGEHPLFDTEMPVISFLKVTGEAYLKAGDSEILGFNGSYYKIEEFDENDAPVGGVLFVTSSGARDAELGKIGKFTGTMKGLNNKHRYHVIAAKPAITGTSPDPSFFTYTASSQTQLPNTGFQQGSKSGNMLVFAYPRAPSDGLVLKISDYISKNKDFKVTAIEPSGANPSRPWGTITRSSAKFTSGGTPTLGSDTMTGNFNKYDNKTTGIWQFNNSPSGFDMSVMLIPAAFPSICDFIFAGYDSGGVLDEFKVVTVRNNQTVSSGINITFGVSDPLNTNGGFLTSIAGLAYYFEDFRRFDKPDGTPDDAASLAYAGNQLQMLVTAPGLNVTSWSWELFGVPLLSVDTMSSSTVTINYYDLGVLKSKPVLTQDVPYKLYLQAVLDDGRPFSANIDMVTLGSRL